MENFIRQYQAPKKLCDDLITYHKKHDEYKNTGRTYDPVTNKILINKNFKDSIDVAIFNGSSDKTVMGYFNFLSKAVQDYIDEFNLQGSFRTDYTSNIQYYPPGGGIKEWHNERTNVFSGYDFIASRALVFMTYLNTVKDKGETEFLYQKIKFKPKKGLTLIWPTDFTHTHRGIPAPSEKKWIITGWFKKI